MYLHWFDKLFYRVNGPAQWAKAKLVRYADDFVVLARYQGPALRGWIEEKIEKWLGLEINRDKTRVVDLREDKASLDFLGYTFRWHRDQYGRNRRSSVVGSPKRFSFPLTFCLFLARPLGSLRITGVPRYYGPLRLPARAAGGYLFPLGGRRVLPRCSLAGSPRFLG